jgi:hypothetical protein
MMDDIQELTPSWKWLQLFSYWNVFEANSSCNISILVNVYICHQSQWTACNRVSHFISLAVELSNTRKWLNNTGTSVHDKSAMFILSWWLTVLRHLKFVIFLLLDVCCFLI